MLVFKCDICDKPVSGPNPLGITATNLSNGSTVLNMHLCNDHAKVFVKQTEKLVKILLEKQTEK